MPVVAHAQQQLPAGSGMIIFDINKLSSLSLYADTNGRSAPRTVSFSLNKVGVPEIDSSSRQWFVPEQFHPSYDIFMMRVSALGSGWVQCFVNERGDRYWLRRNSTQVFMKWNEFLLRRAGTINKLPDVETPIYAAPQVSSKMIRMLNGDDCLKVVEVKGEWMRVRSEKQCDGSASRVRSGWIRWKKNDRIVIGYALLS
jgi:hypothetical protein